MKTGWFEMRYLKRIWQGLLILGIIWLTYTNSNATVSLDFFGRKMHNVSAVIVVVVSLFAGALLTSFFAVLRELKSSKVFKETEKENLKLRKELEEAIRDKRLIQVDLDELRVENNSLKKRVEAGRKNESTGIIL